MKKQSRDIDNERYSVIENASKRFGPDWRRFTIQFVGKALHTFGRDPTEKQVRARMPNESLPYFVDDDRRLIQVHTVFIYLSSLSLLPRDRLPSKEEMQSVENLPRALAYWDIHYQPAATEGMCRVTVDLRNVPYLTTWAAFQNEVKPLWEGLALRGLIEMRLGGGRGKDTGHINESNKWEAHALVIEQGRAIVREGGDPTAPNVAKGCNGKYGISGRSKDAARKTMNRLAKKCYPPRGTWRNDILPLIKENRSS